jgi:hypothetical protein
VQKVETQLLHASFQPTLAYEHTFGVCYRGCKKG